MIVTSATSSCSSNASRSDAGATEPVRTDGQPRHLGVLVLDEPLHRVEHRVVLDGRGDDPAARGVGVAACPVDALDGEVVALGAARGEDDLRRPRAQQLGQRLARLLHASAGRPTRRVQRRRVPDRRQHGRHRLDGSGVHRGGGGVIQVDGAHGPPRIRAESRSCPQCRQALSSRDQRVPSVDVDDPAVTSRAPRPRIAARDRGDRHRAAAATAPARGTPSTAR